MDEVAALAAVSKQTVYKQFADKKQLFTAIISSDISAAEAPTHRLVAALPESRNIERDLRRLARQHIIDVTQPHLIRLRRILIAEAERFPELARTWYSTGPDRAHTVLAEAFQALTRRGLLQVDDPRLAAQHFNWLIVAIPLHEAMFSGVDPTFAPAQLKRYADEGVRVFLAAYRAP